MEDINLGPVRTWPIFILQKYLSSGPFYKWVQCLSSYQNSVKPYKPSKAPYYLWYRTH